MLRIVQKAKDKPKTQRVKAKCKTKCKAKCTIHCTLYGFVYDSSLTNVQRVSKYKLTKLKER